MITFGSVCSGIEAASVAWIPLGWKPLWFSEIEPFPNAVLAHRFPDVPNLGDMTMMTIGTMDSKNIVNGTPTKSRRPVALLAMVCRKTHFLYNTNEDN